MQAIHLLGWRELLTPATEEGARRLGVKARRSRGTLMLALVAIVAVLAVVLVWTTMSSRQHRFSRTIELTSVTFTDARHGWMAGQRTDSHADFKGGVIFATTDGGTTWKTQYTTSAVWPVAVAFADCKVGWAVGLGESASRDTILATRDGGRTWVPQGSGTHCDLESVACVDPTHAWAVGGDLSGSRGVIVATSDGGDHWRKQYGTTSTDLCDVAFANDSDGYAVGGRSILTTRDGGVTWKAQSPGVKVVEFHSVACIDPAHVWAAGDTSRGGVILASTDAGRDWTVQYAGAMAGVTDLAFGDATHGWAIGDGILATSDGGASWRRQYSTSGSMGLGHICCRGAARAWLVASLWKDDADRDSQLFDGSVVLTTGDGGRTWKR